MALIRIGQCDTAVNGLGQRGELRLFTIVEGYNNLQWQWQTLATVTIRAVNGQEAEAKVATFPVEKDNHGFIQFV